MSLSQQDEIQNLERGAEKLAEENLQEAIKVDQLLEELENELEKAENFELKIIKQEKQGNADVRRKKKKVNIDKEIEAEIEDSLNRIMEAKQELDDAITPLRNSQLFALIAGFAAEIGKSEGPTEELMEEIDAAIRDELNNSIPREKMAKIGERAADLEKELIDGRQKLKQATEELEDAKNSEREKIKSENNPELRKGDKKVYEIIEDVSDKTQSITNFNANLDDLKTGSARNTGPLDLFIGTLSLTANLAEYEIN